MVHKTCEFLNCTSCNLLYVLDKDGFCEYCNPISFKRSYLSKLDNRGLEGFSTDITINKSECGK